MTDDPIEEIKEPAGGEENGAGGAEKAEQVGEKKPPNQIRRPRPVQPVENREPIGKAKGKGKKKKRRLLLIILIVVIVLLIGGFVFEELYFNFLGIRDIFIDAVVKLDPDYRSREMRLDERESKLYTLQTDLDEREKTVTTKETQNKKRSADLDAREKTIGDKEAWLTPRFRSQLTDQEILDLQSLSMAYAKMAPEEAADILVKLHRPEDAAVVLYYMTERSAGAILAAMDHEFAAAITQVLLYD